MKTKNVLIVTSVMFMVVVLSSFKSIRTFAHEFGVYQEGFIVYATFDGHEDYGYNFLTKGKDGEEYTITFHDIEEPVLSVFDLNSDTLIGTKFKVTFNKHIKKYKDENGMDDEDEINTITKLEKL
ncbi:hypothetical protein [Hyunsoonleella ulvae]|uniref:hypothetical protein n=1 Tax=Hyunsoonleella ulvae TaxID=2799948 RepID=UPI00193987CE|nr:hypothetical protein [Hyunsoonleella ulvae]